MLEMVDMCPKRDYLRGKDVFLAFQKIAFWKKPFFGMMGGEFCKCVGGV